jgi:hypothetical protein
VDHDGILVMAHVVQVRGRGNAQIVTTGPRASGAVVLGGDSKPGDVVRANCLLPVLTGSTSLLSSPRVLSPTRQAPAVWVLPPMRDLAVAASWCPGLRM